MQNGLKIMKTQARVHLFCSYVVMLDECLFCWYKGSLNIALHYHFAELFYMKNKLKLQQVFTNINGVYCKMLRTITTSALTPSHDILQLLLQLAVLRSCKAWPEVSGTLCPVC